VKPPQENTKLSVTQGIIVPGILNTKMSYSSFRIKKAETHSRKMALFVEK